jgi:hypothetical protein
MSPVVCSPQWFCSLNVILHIIFVLVASAVSYSYYRAFKVTKDTKFLFFSFGFIVINHAYVTKVIVDLFLMPSFVIHLRFQTLLELFSLLYILYMIFIFAGYMFFIIGHARTEKKSIFVLLSCLLALLLIESLENPVFFNLTAVILISFVIWHSLGNFLVKRNANSGLIAAAFVCIAASHLFFITNILGITEGLTYLLGYTAQLGGFILLLITLARIYYGRQKKPR